MPAADISPFLHLSPKRSEPADMTGQVEPDDEASVLVGDPVEAFQEARERDKLDDCTGPIAPNQIWLCVAVLPRRSPTSIGPIPDIPAKDSQRAIWQIVRIKDHLALDTPIVGPPDCRAAKERCLSLRCPTLALEAGH